MSAESRMKSIILVLGSAAFTGILLCGLKEWFGEKEKYSQRTSDNVINVWGETIWLLIFLLYLCGIIVFGSGVFYGIKTIISP